MKKGQCTPWAPRSRPYSAQAGDLFHCVHMLQLHTARAGVQSMDVRRCCRCGRAFAPPSPPAPPTPPKGVR